MKIDTTKKTNDADQPTKFSKIIAAAEVQRKGYCIGYTIVPARLMPGVITSFTMSTQPFFAEP